jgi:iron complex transport system substrate-binding protein
VGLFLLAAIDFMILRQAKFGIGRAVSTVRVKINWQRRLGARCVFCAVTFSLLFAATLSSRTVTADAGGALFTDEIGRQVRVPSRIQRVVSLAPNLTEIVYALGEGDLLAGDTDFCDYPEAATRKPHVGGPVNPSMEQIAALRPDLILATKSINRRETVDALARIGLPVYVTDPRSVDTMIASVEHIGTVLHADQATTSLVTDLRARLARLNTRLAGKTSRRVLFVVWTSPLISVGRDTFIADALRHADAQSVVDTATEWPHVSLEEIVRLQPEFLVLASAHAADTQQEIAQLQTRPGWRDLRAVRERKVVVISEAINRPAPRMVDAIEQLARAVHPDAFAAENTEPPPAAKDLLEACACAR